MSSLFADLRSRAQEASLLAIQDTETQLTGQFRDHLHRSGVPINEIRGCRIVHDDETKRFVPELTPAVSELDLGNQQRGPMGLTTRFFNHVDVPKMHDASLYRACKKVGLA